MELEKQSEAARIKSIRKELEWVRANPKGRHAKSKARLKRFDELNSREFQQRAETNEIYIPPGPRLGDLVVQAENVSKAFGENVLYENLNFSLPPGGIVGVIGANGAGKTTLFNMMTGDDEPTAGNFRVGDSVKIACVDQSRDALDAGKTVWEEVSGGQDVMRVGGVEVQSRRYLGRFNFKRADQQKRVGELSGGERNRVHLAKIIKRRRQPFIAGRTDQRLGRRNFTRFGRSHLKLPRLRGSHLSRPLVLRPNRHAHFGIGRKLKRHLVRRKLQRLRTRLQTPPRRNHKTGRGLNING